MGEKQKIEWEVGQEVIYQYGTHRARMSQETVPITRIGRKYVYARVHGRHEQAFNKDDGRLPNWSSGGRLVTPEILAAEERRRAAMERIKPLRDVYGLDRLSTDQIERIAEIIEEG